MEVGPRAGSGAVWSSRRGDEWQKRERAPWASSRRAVWLLPLPDDSKSAAAIAKTGTSGGFAAGVDFAGYDVSEHI